MKLFPLAILKVFTMIDINKRTSSKYNVLIFVVSESNMYKGELVLFFNDGFPQLYL